MNLLTCFNIDLCRDALCKIGNGMHNDHIGKVNSRLAHTLAMRTEAKITFLLQTVACLQGHQLAVPMGTVLLMLRNFWIRIESF